MKVFVSVDGVAVGERDVSKVTATMLHQLKAKKLVGVFDPRVAPPREKEKRETIQEGDVVVVTTK